MKNKIIVIDVDILKMDILVCVGTTKKYLQSWAKRQKVSKDFKEVCDEIKEEALDCAGYCVCMQHVKSKKYFHSIFLEDYKNDWDYVNIILHEVVHLKQNIFKVQKIGAEEEFEAYFVESIFNKIRQELNRVYDHRTKGN